MSGASETSFGVEVRAVVEKVGADGISKKQGAEAEGYEGNRTARRCQAADVQQRLGKRAREGAGRDSSRHRPAFCIKWRSRDNAGLCSPSAQSLARGCNGSDILRFHFTAETLDSVVLSDGEAVNVSVSLSLSLNWRVRLYRCHCSPRIVLSKTSRHHHSSHLTGSRADFVQLRIP